MDLRLLVKVLICWLLICAAEQSLLANLLSNGDFETTGSGETFSSGYASVGAGTLIPGWTTTLSTNGSAPGTYHSSTDSGGNWIPNPVSGNYCVQLDSTNTPNGWTVGNSIATTYKVTRGTVYSLSFWICTEVGDGKGGTAGIDLNIAGGGSRVYYSTVSGATPFTSTNPVDVSREAAGWTRYSVTFTPTRTENVTIRFTDDQLSGNSNISLDNVSLEIAPEVSHWAVFLLFGLACAGFEIRRRTRSVVCPV